MIIQNTLRFAPAPNPFRPLAIRVAAGGALAFALSVPLASAQNPRARAASPAAPPATNSAPPNATATGGAETAGPTTLTGEAAPPLRVPPPPQLLPQVTPALPQNTKSLIPIGAPLTIDQAVTLGLKYQTNVGIAHQGAVAASGETQQAESGLGPSVTAAAEVARTNVNTIGGSSSGFQGSLGTTFSEGLTLHQLVYDFQHTSSGVDSARHTEAAAQENESTIVKNTTLTIKQDFLTLLEDQRLIGVNEATVKAQQGNLDEAMATYMAGTAPQADVLQAQTNLAQALLALSTARNNASIAMANLNIALGIDPRTPLTLADVATPTSALPDLNSLVAQAFTHRPEVVEARDVVASNEANLRNKRTNNMPAVVANGSLGLGTYSFPGNELTETVALDLQWDAFDYGLTKGLVKQAKANLDSARLQLQQTELSVGNDVTQAYLNASNAQQQILTTASEVANAQESLRLAEGQYAAGVGIFLVVTTAQAALAQALADQVNATYGLDIALATLDHAVGR